MFIGKPSALLQIFCKIILDIHIIVKRNIDPDKIFLRNSWELKG